MRGIAIGGPFHGYTAELPDTLEQWLFTRSEGNDEALGGIFVYTRWPSFDIFTRPDNAVAFTYPDVCIRQMRFQISAVELVRARDPKALVAEVKARIQANATLDQIKHPDILRGVWVESVHLETLDRVIQFSWLTVPREGVPDLPAVKP